MQFPTLLLAILGVLLPITTASLTPSSDAPAILQKRDDANVSVWIPTPGPQQFCHDFTILNNIPPEPNKTAPDCRALRAKYAPPIGNLTKNNGTWKNVNWNNDTWNNGPWRNGTQKSGYNSTAKNGYWNITVDMHPTIGGVNSTWPFSIMDADGDCTVYVDTAIPFNPSVNVQIGSVDLVNILDTVISSNATSFSRASCTNPSTNETNYAVYWVGSGRFPAFSQKKRPT